jgi:hypothetical protein
MRPSMLGALLGLANMVVIASAIALDLGEGGEAFGAILVLGALPALMAGVALGAAAHRTREWSLGSRYAVIGLPAFVVLVLCGSVIIPFAYYIPFACVPTFIAVRILERRTRVATTLPPVIQWRQPISGSDTRFVMRLDPVALGMVLAFATLIVVSIGMAGLQRGAYDSPMYHHGSELCMHDHAHHSAWLAVFILGLVPALVTGVIAGRIAHRCRDWPVWSRRLVVVPLPLAVVVMLGGISGLYEYVLPALIPTLVAALWLERGASVVAARRGGR